MKIESITKVIYGDRSTIWLMRIENKYEQIKITGKQARWLIETGKWEIIKQETMANSIQFKMYGHI